MHDSTHLQPTEGTSAVDPQRVLSAAQKDQFARDGYLIFDPGIPLKLIDSAVAALDSLYLDSDQTPDTTASVVAYRDDRRIQDAWKIVEQIKAMAVAPRVIGALRDLYDRQPLPFQTLNFRVGSEQKTHSDTIHFNSDPAGFMCGVWVALEDIDHSNGPVAYYPGTHAWPEATLSDVDLFLAGSHIRLWLRRGLARLKRQHRRDRDATADYLAYERMIADRIARAGMVAQYATIKKGQAFIWAANLLHGGSVQLDRNRTRHSLVTHYFFEGCRHHTPLLKRGGETCWRAPAWIA
ncbi:hypothetical protein LYSHEL_22150 [Lysobacter helvus]|uniref:Phytanoyl-CoA dioxygenase n=2 Tax=Lysobacteraceae TaxID=32033 RepID=A0ABN6FU26_9GAMM|nr:hypothetical protein LYSCAS_22160 [Lysobacter caseinilyticus]BCT96344.1 hypothetical protein LYSHEL_22150 [Lysobacter helvus]